MSVFLVLPTETGVLLYTYCEGNVSAKTSPSQELTEKSLCEERLALGGRSILDRDACSYVVFKIVVLFFFI